MKKSQLLELIKRVVREEQDYQQLFKHMLDKVGKSITDMSDDEKKKFFNAVDTAYKAKSEGRLRGYNENVNEGKKTFKINPPIGSSKYSISFHDGNKKHGDGSDFYDIKIFKNKIDLEKAIKDFKSKGFIAMNEAELTDKQKQIDVDKDGEIEGSDLAALRAKNEAWAPGPYVGIENTPTGPKLVKTFSSGSQAYAWVMKAGGGHSIMTQKQWNLGESVKGVKKKV